MVELLRVVLLQMRLVLRVLLLMLVERLLVEMLLLLLLLVVWMEMLLLVLMLLMLLVLLVLLADALPWARLDRAASTRLSTLAVHTRAYRCQSWRKG